MGQGVKHGPEFCFCLWVAVEVSTGVDSCLWVAVLLSLSFKAVSNQISWVFFPSLTSHHVGGSPCSDEPLLHGKDLKKNFLLALSIANIEE